MNPPEQAAVQFERSPSAQTACLRKIRAHQIKREEAEQALLNNPIPIYEQSVLWHRP